MMKKYSLATFSSLMAVALVFLPESGAAAGDTAYPAAKPQAGKFVVEYVYNYVSRKYTPPVKLNPVTRDKSGRATPEEAFISHFSAMATPDYGWWLSGWMPESQKQIEARNVEHKRGAQDWENIWRSAMKSQVINMVERIDTGPYALIRYEMRDPQGKLTMDSLYVCKKEGDAWLATEELAEDLMFHHYTKGKKRVTLNVR